MLQEQTNTWQASTQSQPVLTRIFLSMCHRILVRHKNNHKKKNPLELEIK